MVDYTVVVGVDRHHLEELYYTWPTWKRHKAATILERPMIVFYDRRQISPGDVKQVVDHPDLRLFPWPFRRPDAQYDGDDRDGDTPMGRVAKRQAAYVESVGEASAWKDRLSRWDTDYDIPEEPLLPVVSGAR